METATIDRPAQTRGLHGSKLIVVRDVCEMLNRCRSTVLRLDDAGEIPRSVRLGDSPTRLWVREHLERWIADGCPRLTGAPTAM